MIRDDKSGYTVKIVRVSTAISFEEERHETVMKRKEIASLFADADQLMGQTLTVCGWVRTLRQSKAIGFIELNDGSCQRNLQVVIEQDNLSNFQEIAKTNVGAALCVTGTLSLTPGAAAF